MSRSRKQRERKLNRKLTELQQKHAAMRNQLAAQSDVLIDYVGGVAEFGHEVLKLIARLDILAPTDLHRFGLDVLDHARQMGFIEPDPNFGIGNRSRKYKLTHMCKQLMGGSDGQAKAPDDGD